MTVYHIETYYYIFIKGPIEKAYTLVGFLYYLLITIKA